MAPFSVAGSSALFVEKKRQGPSSCASDSDSTTSFCAIYRTAPSSPAKGSQRGSPYKSRLDPYEFLRSGSPVPRIPPAIRMTQFPVLQPSVNVSYNGGYDVSNVSKTNLLPSTSANPGHGAPSPLILVPQIKATPAVEVIKEGAAVSLWVAVEVFAKLAAPASVDAFLMGRPLDQQLCIGKKRRLEGQDGWYGCLYNMEAYFTPCPGTYIERIVEGLPRRSLATGDSILFLVKVLIQPGPKPDSEYLASQAHTTDDLIQDLELQLGSVTREYLIIRLSYNHTGFPNQMLSEPEHGVKISTYLNTTATAVIRIGDVESGWVKEANEEDEAKSSLAEIIKSHGWDENLIREAMDLVRPGIMEFPPVPLSPGKIEVPVTFDTGESQNEGSPKLPPISPTRMKLASICPLRKVRSFRTPRLAASLAASSPKRGEMENDAPSVQSSPKTLKAPKPLKSKMKGGTIGRRRSWFFW